MPKSKEVISDSESGSASSEEEVKSKSKPKKQEKKVAKSASESSESEEDSKSKKRSKKSNDGKDAKKAKKDTKKNDSDEPTWEIGRNKRVTVRQFKGKWFVDIRETYMDKDGDIKPGKKGICMNLDNWKELTKVFEEVDECVKSKC